MSGFVPANLPVPGMRDENPGVTVARRIVGGGPFSQIRPELNRAPANAQFSALGMLTSNHVVPQRYPSSVAIPADIFDADTPETFFAHHGERNGLNFYVPTFSDRSAAVVLEKQTNSPLLGLGAINCMLYRLSSRLDAAGGAAARRDFYNYVRLRYNFLGALTALATRGSYTERTGTVARSGRAFVADVWRNVFAYFTSGEDRAIARDGLGVADLAEYPTPYNPYTIGNRLGFVLAWVPERWVTDPLVATKSLPDLVALADRPVLQFVPVASTSPGHPTWASLYGGERAARTYVAALMGEFTNNEVLAEEPFFVAVGVVAPTAVEADPHAEVGSPAGIGAPHSAIFPGPEPESVEIPSGDPISVFLTPGNRSG
jgi:hypothetical protein